MCVFFHKLHIGISKFIFLSEQVPQCDFKEVSLLVLRVSYLCVAIFANYK